MLTTTVSYAALQNIKSEHSQQMSECSHHCSHPPDRHGGFDSTTLSWMQKIFNGCRRAYQEKVEPFPEADYEVVSTTLSWAFKCYNSQLTDDDENEPKRIHLIAPVLWGVTHLLSGVKVKVEEDLMGKQVHAKCHYEFLISNGSKYVCVMRAKENDFEQAITKNMLGCEVWSCYSRIVKRRWFY